MHNLILEGRLSSFGKENLRERVLSKFGKKKKKRRSETVDLHKFSKKPNSFLSPFVLSVLDLFFFELQNCNCENN